MNDDAQLLLRYREERSEAAFTELMRRHLDLVYSAALRQVNGDRHLAEDVTQTVFTQLARQARRLAHHPCLTAWLYTSVRYAAANLRREFQRRQEWERQAHTMNELLHDPEPEPSWDQLRPVLDDAMHDLATRDREAVLLRYFEGRDLKSVGVALGLSEDAARMRVNRALEKLHVLLTGRGVTLSAATVAAALTAQAVQASPLGLATAVTSVALADVTFASHGVFGFFKLMTFSKLQLTVGSAVVTALIAVPLALRPNWPFANGAPPPASNAVRRAATPPVTNPPPRKIGFSSVKTAAWQTGTLRRKMLSGVPLSRPEQAFLIQCKSNAEAYARSSENFGIFQAGFIGAVLGIEEPDRLWAFRRILEEARDTEHGQGLDVFRIPKPPALPNLEQLRASRLALDRATMATLNTRLSASERDAFARAFTSALDINLGIDLEPADLDTRPEFKSLSQMEILNAAPLRKGETRVRAFRQAINKPVEPRSPE